MIKCELKFTSPTSAYAFDYKPEGKEAYDLAKGKNFDHVNKLYRDVVTNIPLTLAIRSELFKNSFVGTVNVKKNSLLWAVYWYVEDNTLKAIIDTQLIVDIWEQAGLPSEWDGSRENHNTKKLYAKKIGILERKITDYKNKLLDVIGYNSFDELERCTQETCVFPDYYDKCIGKFANVCEAF